MDVGTLEQGLWDAACEIRGLLHAPRFLGRSAEKALVVAVAGKASASRND